MKQHFTGRQDMLSGFGANWSLQKKNDNKQHTVKWYNMNKGDKYCKAIHVPYGLTYRSEMKTPSS
jgi:hypothetical protein